MPHELPALPYDFGALEPHIDEQTMHIHHGKHHAGYVRNLNAALEKHSGLADWPVEKLVAQLSEVPEDIRTAVRNNGGGHANHTLFWSIMGPNGGGNPTGDLADAISGAFGDFDSFKQQLTAAATGRFGSGWAWLTLDSGGKMSVESTPNQDNPLTEGRTPILGVDVWEHAYYLKYQNRRPDYLAAWFNTIDWNAVGQRHSEAIG